MPDSQAELEIAWLRGESGITADASLSELRQAVYVPNEHAYWAAQSGLAVGSLTDHKITTMKTALGVSTGSLADISRAFWA